MGRPSIKHETEIVMVPRRFTAFMERRTHRIVRACFHESNVLRAIALSCYQQGLVDGFEAAQGREDRSS